MGINCWWCGDGHEGDTRVPACACGSFAGEALAVPRAPVALVCSAGDPTDPLGDSRWHCAVTELDTRGTALSPTRVTLRCHCRGHA